MKHLICQMLEQNGIGFDWARYQSDVLKTKAEQEEQVVKALCSLLHCSKRALLDPNWQAWCLYHNRIYPKSLAIDYLKEHRQEHEAYELLYRYKRLRQFQNQYGNKLFEQIDPDGRIHAEWSLDGAKTGRMSCCKPNLQAFPNEVKPYFKPRDGYCFVSGDYSQIELRVLAELSGDKCLIQSFRDKVDIHTGTASKVFDKPLCQITEEERTVGKRINFGICYGISSQGLCKVLKKATGHTVDIREADAMRQNFYSTHPEILAYHDALLKAQTITSLGGQTWNNYPPGIARINLPVQASAAEGLKLALFDLIIHLPEDCLLVNVIHDEIILEVPVEKSEHMQIVLQKSMVDGMQRILKSVPIEVDINIKL